MPTDHAEVTLRGVRGGDDAVLGELGAGLVLAQRFVHENASDKRPRASVRPPSASTRP